ncbi:MAG TPA: hypothetical protein VF914_04140 [Chloroflexia bacterium]|jgi:hypothetical protein
MLGEGKEEYAGSSRQSRRWHDSEQYLAGKIDLDEFEKRAQEYETDYGSVMIGLARKSQKPRAVAPKRTI